MPLTLSGTSATHIIRGENASAANGASGVYGLATAGSGATYGGRFESASTAFGASGVYGSGFQFGGRFECASMFGIGVRGDATATSGESFGVWGQIASMEGAGVRGEATAASGFTYGVLGASISTTGRGVYGVAFAVSGVTYGVLGQSNSTTGRGVYGLATAASGAPFGVYGQSNSTTGRGVYGVATAASGSTIGVLGDSPSTSGTGVHGRATATSGFTFGVHGITSSATNGYGVFSTGRFGASGTKAFQIDHPFDPEGKYLNHYCAEGPEPLLIYRGNVVLDEKGEAWVQLPEYFEEINRDFHYQLTCIGGFAPVYVAQEIRGNSFRIGGGVAGMKVSWSVTGVRNDPFVRTYGAPVEQQKPEGHRGKYLHPELYGQPKEMGMNWRPEPPNEEKPAGSGK